MAKSFKVLPHMCARQKEDFDALLYAADEIGAAATSVIAQGGQGYNLLLEARDRFRSILSSMTDNYRICIEEEGIEKTFTINI